MSCYVKPFDIKSRKLLFFQVVRDRDRNIYNFQLIQSKYQPIYITREKKKVMVFDKYLK